MIQFQKIIFLPFKPDPDYAFQNFEYEFKTESRKLNGKQKGLRWFWPQDSCNSPQRTISRDVLEWIAMLIKGDAINNTYNDLQ